ncbi:hypothetical protein [Chitinophaga filiformis]|uniref:Uncharacterized protein n=1 Tax=Chitinophaga filiformis TaxID=104663 RepID=A0A1G7NVE7_CHIFI|nr:hypothetical protein [Chitinophaga filiformis]SDF78016.1 hypothetical protein SAMN04488121_102957 [Chitinophaga filiformis]
METQNLAAQKVLVAVPTENAQTTTLTISSVSADEIDVEYATMPGNQPNTYGNFLAIWQNPNSVPWNTEPLQPIFYIQTNTPSGSAAFTGLNVNNNDYIIGYSTGPILTAGGNVQKYGNVCATAYIPKAGEGGQGNIFTPAISGINIGATSVSFQFDLPDGILPLTNGAWAGLWRGANPSFYTVAPQSFIPISLDYSSGRAAFNNVSIGRGLTYTIGIFMSGYKSGGGSTQRTLACSASFTN